VFKSGVFTANSEQSFINVIQKLFLKNDNTDFTEEQSFFALIEIYALNRAKQIRQV